MCKNRAEAEAPAVVPEIYTGDAIESIRFFGNKKHPDHIGIRLKDGKYIEVVPVLNSSLRSLESQLELKRGRWLK